MRTPTKERFAAALGEDDRRRPRLARRPGARSGAQRALPRPPGPAGDRGRPDDGGLRFSFRREPRPRGHRRHDRAPARAARRASRAERQAARRARLRRVPGGRRLDPTLPNLMRAVFQTPARGRARLPRAASGTCSRRSSTTATSRSGAARGRWSSADPGERARGVRRAPGSTATERDIDDEAPRDAPRRHRRSPVRDAGARVLHLGAGAPRARGARAATSRRRSRTSSAPSTTTSRESGTGAPATSDSSCSPSARAREPLRRGDAGAQRAARGDVRPARGHGAVARGHRREGGRRALPDRRALPRRVARARAGRGWTRTGEAA